MWECNKCGEYRFNSVQECHCKKFVVLDGDLEEHAIQAMTEEDAALKFAEKYNEDGDYALMNTTMVIVVGGKDFEISAEPDIHYSANEI